MWNKILPPVDTSKLSPEELAELTAAKLMGKPDYYVVTSLSGPYWPLVRICKMTGGLEVFAETDNNGRAILPWSKEVEEGLRISVGCKVEEVRLV